MSKVTLTRIFKGMKNTKYGEKPSVSFKCAEHGDKWISTFKTTPIMDTWKEGDVVEVNITEKNGFMNFDTGTPSATAGLEARVKAIEDMIGITSQEPTVKLGQATPKDEPVDDFEF